ncbi:MAG: hypothetical protein J7J86_00880 [Bacteroidales bacterium]|nr:hypothetical protein [Bacteroidales bacterium]
MLKHRNIIKIFFVLMIFVVACSNKTVKIIENKYPDGFPQIVNYYKIVDGDSILIMQTAYYDNHNKKYEGKFLNNKRNGKWTYWFENGNKWSVGIFKNGINEGKRTVWYENGQKHYDAIYKNGERAGEWVFYDINGNVLKKINYDK